MHIALTPAKILKRLSGQQEYSAFETWQAVKTELSRSDCDALSWSELFDAISRNSTSICDSIILSACRKLADSPHGVPNLSWRDLQSLSSFLPFTKSGGAIYEDLIMHCDPSVRIGNDLGYYNSSFLATGWGPDALHCFRSVSNGTTTAFEKVYKRKSPSIWRVQRFYTDIAPVLQKKGMQLPALYSMECGHVVMAAYIELLPFQDQGYSDHELIDSAVAITTQLAHVTLSGGQRDLADRFRKNRSYISSRRKAFRSIPGSIIGRAIALAEFEKKVQHLPIVFGHGDLAPVNFDSRGTVIDWDDCGYYPVGYDLAFALSRIVAPTSVIEIEELVASKVKKPTAADTWNQYLFSFLYFFLVFYVGKGSGNSADQKQKFACETLCRLKELDVV